MAEDAKNPAADNSAADEKVRAEDKPLTNEDTAELKQPAEESQKESSREEEPPKEIAEAEVVKDIPTEPETADASDDAKDTNAEDSEKTDISDSSSSSSSSEFDEDFQQQVRDQIENCKFEIVAALQDSVHTELTQVTEKQVRKVERRRRMGYLVRDILILLLASLVGYFGYCLYDAKYFDFLLPECERNNTCQSNEINQPTEPEVVKDTAWYQQKYGYLYDSLQTKLNADEVEAYYLYSGDYKIADIQPSFLLGMAYNRLNASTTYDSTDGIVIPAADLRNAYISLVGDAEHFAKHDFSYHCADFKYDKNLDNFTAKSLLCADNATRQIVENVDEIYEEGNALYFLTTAAIFNRAEQSFYTFDNLFKPAVSNVTADDITKHASLLNHYQYQFKKVDDKYYFSGITKLK